jgi:membrane protein
MPINAVAPVIEALEQANILVATADEPPRYLPGRAIDTISLKAVLDAVRRADADGAAETRHAILPNEVAGLMVEIERGAESALAGRTLADVVAKARAAA